MSSQSSVPGSSNGRVFTASPRPLSPEQLPRLIPVRPPPSVFTRSNQERDRPRTNYEEEVLDADGVVIVDGEDGQGFDVGDADKATGDSVGVWSGR